MKKALLSIGLLAASSMAVAASPDMPTATDFNFDTAKKSVSAGLANVADMSGVRFAGRVDFTSGFYADVSYYTVSDEETVFGESLDLTGNQLLAVVGKNFGEDWFAQVGFANVSAEIKSSVGKFDDSATELAWKAGKKFNLQNNLEASVYLADEGGDIFVGALAEFSINEKFGVKFQYDAYSDSHMYFLGEYKF
ncbi:MAG: hypothetical protein HWE10_08375 [Gammaproteobacteria bacterium]|nr:hypothetical protein [Gammaproteobacteria bacterium]